MTNRQSRFLSVIKPSRAFILLGLVYLAGLVFFSLSRGLFAFSFSEQLAGVPLLDICRAFGIGLRFDTVIILYLLILPLLTMPWLTLRSGVVRLSLTVYLSLFFSASFLLLIGDIYFFKIAESHLNYLAIDYLKDGRTGWTLVLSAPGFYAGVIGWLGASILFAYLIRTFISKTSNIAERVSWPSQIIWWVLLIAISIVGARGRTELSPLRWGGAYFSDNHFINQLGLNGIWSLAQTFKSEEGDPRLSYLDPADRFPFVPFDEALAETQAMIAGPNDEWLDQTRSVSRLTRQAKNGFGFDPNVIIILMESFSGRMVGVLGSDLGLTPEFDRLAKHGILFDRFYAGGERTSYGMAATLASSPALPGRSVQKRYAAAHPFRTLSQILNERGYYNILAYGGDKEFDNIDGFYRSKKYDAVLGDSDFGSELVLAKWGIPDHILFDRVSKMIDRLPRPFQMTLLTLSNHEPFDLPDSSAVVFRDDSYQSKLRNAFAYADWSLGRFVDSLTRSKVVDSTILIFVADHTRHIGSAISVDPTNFHIPFLIYSPALLGDPSRTVSTVGGQVDITPTLMGLLGSDYKHASWGRDLLRVDSTESGFAVLRIADRVGLIEDGYLYVEPLGQTPRMYQMSELHDSLTDRSTDLPDEFHRLQRRMRLYLQAAEQLSTPGRTSPAGQPE